MINDKNAIAIIPARGGSKGLPGKNIQKLCGKPLIAWSIEQAQQSKYLDEIVVSTDSPEIASVAQAYGAPPPFMRPADLATDHASTYAVIQHALDHYRTSQQREFDYVVLLEPTSPLREQGDIDRMLAAIDARSAEFNTLVSVGQTNHHPSILQKITDDRLQPFCPDLVPATRRQDNEPAYFPCAIAYIAKASTLRDENTFYGKRCLAFPVKRYQNYDIDDLHDFLCVEAMMKHEWGL